LQETGLGGLDPAAGFDRPAYSCGATTNRPKVGVRGGPPTRKVSTERPWKHRRLTTTVPTSPMSAPAPELPAWAERSSRSPLLGRAGRPYGEPFFCLFFLFFYPVTKPRRACRHDVVERGGPPAETSRRPRLPYLRRRSGFRPRGGCFRSARRGDARCRSRCAQGWSGGPPPAGVRGGGGVSGGGGGSGPGVGWAGLRGALPPLGGGPLPPAPVPTPSACSWKRAAST